MPRKTKAKTLENHVSVETDFGNRKVSQQNFSKIVVLPKTALDNCDITSHVNVKLVQSKDEKFIKLTSVENNGDVTNE